MYVRVSVCIALFVIVLTSRESSEIHYVSLHIVYRVNAYVQYMPQECLVHKTLSN